MAGLVCVSKECFARVQTLLLRCGDRLGRCLSMVRIGWLGVQRWVNCRLSHMLFGSHPLAACVHTVSL